MPASHKHEVSYNSLCHLKRPSYEDTNSICVKRYYYFYKELQNESINEQLDTNR